MSHDPRFLESCEREQLHRSGAIQPHGTLLVAAPDGLVTHAGANTDAWLGMPPETVIGRALPTGLDRLMLELGGDEGTRISRYLQSVGTRVLTVVATRAADGSAILECTAAEPGPGLRIPDSPGGIPHTDDELTARREHLVRTVAALTGFSRVLFYRFRDDADGEVVSEVAAEGTTGSYLGLRFPASDVPQIARALYVKNPWRLIPDVAAAPVTLLGAAGSATPDLTYSDLRSVSPVHQAYLANMGVGASLSVPVVRRGALDALITAHHAVARDVSVATMTQVSRAVKAYTTSLLMFEAQRRMRLVDNLTVRYGDVPARLPVIDQHWNDLAPRLAADFEADGVTFSWGARRLAWGTTGPAEVESYLAPWIERQRQERVLVSESLSGDLQAPVWPDLAGCLLLTVRTPALGPLRVMFTRREHVHDVAWGGNPDKPVETNAGGLSVSPRRSFDAWIEKRRGHSRSWTSTERLLGLALARMMSA